MTVHRITIFKRLVATLCGLLLAVPVLAQTVALQVQANGSINSKTGQAGKPTQMVIYQLASADAFKKAKFFTLYDNPRKALQGALIGSKTDVIVPRSSKTIQLALANDTRFIGVLLAYENYRGKTWRQVINVDDIPTDVVHLALSRQGIRVLAMPKGQRKKVDRYYVQGSLGLLSQYSYSNVTFAHVLGNNVQLQPNQFSSGMQFNVGGGYQMRPKEAWWNKVGLHTITVGGDFYYTPQLDSTGVGINRYDTNPRYDYNYSNKMNSIRLMMTSKVNFIPNYFMHPYLSAGVGMAFNTDQFTRVDTLDGKTTKLKAITQANFAFQWGLGVDIDLGQNWQISAGYQSVHAGKGLAKEVPTSPSREVLEYINIPVHFTQMTLAVKYLF